MNSETPEGRGVTRLSFMKVSAGAAAATVGIGVPAAVIVTEEVRGVPVAPTNAPQADSVMAYVRDVARGEVTIVAGQSEMTYRDPELVKRLMAAAPKTGNEAA